ncbi:MAG: hypothetical protein QOE65_409 [Solirubrobacteraceae bacterium]|jgi:hypothetical protein|nr:hypothetical protein [Solirubrobacteraceae bacterium]
MRADTHKRRFGRVKYAPLAALIALTLGVGFGAAAATQRVPTVFPAAGGASTAFSVRFVVPIDLRGHGAEIPTYQAAVRGPARFSCRRERTLVVGELAALRARGSRAEIGLRPRPLVGWCGGHFRVVIRLVETKPTRACLRRQEFPPAPDCSVVRFIGRTAFTVARPVPHGPTRVPAVVGLKACGAEFELAVHDLRWRYAGSTPIRDDTDGCSHRFRGPRITGQSTPPGRLVPRRSVIVLTSAPDGE